MNAIKKALILKNYLKLTIWPVLDIVELTKGNTIFEKFVVEAILSDVEVLESAKSL